MSSERYDDEGTVLLFIQHLVDGHPIYDEVKCLYGPAYIAGQWLLFGVFKAPLGNDALRIETLICWWTTATILALAAWRLVRTTVCAAGLTAIVWILAICQLYVLARGPGHPQIVIVILVAASLWLVTRFDVLRQNTALLVLGGIAAALAFTKINVGIFFAAALFMSLLSLTPRSSPWWMSLRVAAAAGLPATPFAPDAGTARPGICDILPLDELHIAACASLACLRTPSGPVRLKDFLVCGLGSACHRRLAGRIFIVAGQYARRHARRARPADLAERGPGSSRLSASDSAAGVGLGTTLAALGLFVSWGKIGRRLLLWPARALFCLAVVPVAASLGDRVGPASPSRCPLSGCCSFRRRIGVPPKPSGSCDTSSHSPLAYSPCKSFRWPATRF